MFIPPESILGALNAIAAGERATEDQLRKLSEWGTSLPEFTQRYVGHWRCIRSGSIVQCDRGRRTTFCGVNIQFSDRKVRDYAVLRTELRPLFPQLGIHAHFMVKTTSMRGNRPQIAIPYLVTFDSTFYLLMSKIGMAFL